MLLLTIRLNATAVRRSKRSEVLNTISAVRISVCSADLLDTTVFAEKRLGVNRLVSLDLSDGILTRFLGISTTAKKSADADLQISLASVDVTRTILNRRSS